MIFNSRFNLLTCLVLLFFLSWSTSTKGNTNSHLSFQVQPEQEVFLSFKYQNLFDEVIIAYLDDGKYFLPVSEIFRILKIPHQSNATSLTITGSYLSPSNEYLFDFKNFTVSLDDKGSFSFDASKMRVKELDYYVQIDILEQVFDLTFSVDLNNLLLQLETPDLLPIVEEFERAERRKRQQGFQIRDELYPLEFERDRSILGGGFLDYSLSANISEDLNSYVYNLDLGTELLGGDLQGSTFGSYSTEFSSFTTNNLRWRYVLRNNKYVSQIKVGQTSSSGLFERNFRGISLTNEPIEPRSIYDSFEIEGQANPGSEVELFYNDVLYDFTRVSEDGQYRFLAPITYGSSRLRLEIFGPNGSVTQRRERIQIPFNFLPKGEVSYNLNVGRLENPIFGQPQESDIAQGDVGYGISSWFTQRVGVEYLSEFTDDTPLFYSSSSARLFDQYLFNLDLAPQAFYRFSGSVIYPSSASWELNYTYFTDDGIFNVLRNDQELSGNFFLPFLLFKKAFSFRFAGNYATNDVSGNNTRYNIDLNTRINRFNLRASYRDQQFGEFNLNPSRSSEVSLAATYLISRKPNIPWYLQNTFISGQLDYNPGLAQLEEAEVQVSRSVFEKGRLQASFSRNFIGDFNFLNLGLTIDFNAFRSTTTTRHVRNKTSLTQNIRGSIGYDDFNNKLLLSNREQVGRSGSSVRLYVDSNNSGSYEEGEETIDDKAVRIGKAGVTSSVKDGVLRFTQLQSYHRINMEINESAIKNPLLVPKLKEFSIVTDPNQYKPINIPFYVSGIIEGKVQRKTSEGIQGLSGVRLFLKAKESNYEKEMQTFSDGSFYAYEVPPGEYSLKVDSTQLDFLDARSDPSEIDFEVESLAEGDYVDGLNFNILPLEDTSEAVIAETDTTSQTEPVAKEDSVQYQIQLASYGNADLANTANNRAEKMLNEEFFVRYNPYAKLFAVRSLPILQKQDAISKTRQIIESPFSEPAVVVTKDTSFSSIDLYPRFVIHLDTLDSIESAEELAKEIDQQTDISIVVSSLADQNKFLVQSSSFNSRKKAEAALKNIQEISDTKKSNYSIVENLGSEITSLYFNYFIQIVEIDTTTSKQYLQDIKEDDILPDGVTVKKGNNEIIIGNLNTWDETITLKRKLENIFSRGTVMLILEQYQK